MATTTERPEIVTDEHLDYLDELRESGVTNMFGAGAYLGAKLVREENKARLAAVQESLL